MTTIATTLKDVDLAMAARYAGVAIDVDSGAGPVSTPVDVFLEEPSTAEYPDRVYPSISIKLLSLDPNFEESHSEDQNEEEIAYTAVPDPPERTMRLRPFPYRISYRVDTWHRIRAGESRDLVVETLIQRTPPRGYVTVPTVDAGSQNLWVFWAGGIAQLDEINADEVIYHKSATVEVLAHLLLDTTTTDRKAATEVQWRIVQERTVASPDGKGVVVIPGEGFLDLTMQIDEDGERPL
jgi:hypothetical protein